jgi:FkbM family methyltransferase
MKCVHGIWLPDEDTHFEAQLAAGPMVGGKATYQYAKYQAAMKFVRNRSHAVDVGAHVGLWTRVMAMDFLRVSAFEPVEEHVECLWLNVGKPVEVLQFAVGAECRPAKVARPADNSGNACVSESGKFCEMVTLDAMHLEPIGLLKIDVEGYELNVVRGAEATIMRDRPVIVVEQKPNNAERYGIGRWDAVNLLKAWGMREAKVISGDHIMVW